MTHYFFFLFLWPYALLSKALSFRGKNDSVCRNNNDLTELEVKAVTQPLGAPQCLSQQAKKGVMLMVEMIDPDSRGKQTNEPQ